MSDEESMYTSLTIVDETLTIAMANLFEKFSSYMMLNFPSKGFSELNWDPFGLKMKMLSPESLTMTPKKMYRRLSMQNVDILEGNELPPHHREVAILKGYRSPQSSPLQCAISVFMATNETLNFWTHFLPSFYFAWQLHTFWDLLRVINDSYTWPFTAYMFSICLYPLISALAHVFFSISNMARHVWFFLDYGALNLYAFGAGLLYKAYVFPNELRHTIIGEFFLEILVVLCIMGTVSACYSRFLSNLFLVKLFRLGAFAMSWIWDSVPLIYRLSYSLDLKSAAAEHYLLQFFFSFFIGFFYASHLPERLAPGKFDFIGNSHQLLHICGVLATYQQMSAALIDMETRREMLVTNKNILPDFWSLYIFPFVFLCILTTIIVFVIKAIRFEKRKLSSRKQQ